MTNQKELDLIRKEMLNLKDCITKYLGYVLAGSGAAVYGIARMDNASYMNSMQNSFFIGMSFVSFIISIIISFITIIMFYKFHSHNRFAGYCKVLSHEKFTFPLIYKNIDYKNINKDEVELTFAWEMAVGKLRCLDNDPDKMRKLIDDSKIYNINKQILFDRVLGLFDLRNKKWKFFHGAKILLLALSGKVVTNSWAFPPFISSICFVLSFGFFIAGHYLAYYKGFPPFFLLFISIVTSLFQGILWWRLIRKLDDLMNGFLTVEAFFVKFIPIRSSFLNSFGIAPEYLDTDNFDLSIICPIKNKRNKITIAFTRWREALRGYKEKLFGATGDA